MSQFSQHAFPASLLDSTLKSRNTQTLTSNGSRTMESQDFGKQVNVSRKAQNDLCKLSSYYPDKYEASDWYHELVSDMICSPNIGKVEKGILMSTNTNEMVTENDELPGHQYTMAVLHVESQNLFAWQYGFRRKNQQPFCKITQIQPKHHEESPGKMVLQMDGVGHTPPDFAKNLSDAFALALDATRDFKVRDDCPRWLNQKVVNMLIEHVDKQRKRHNDLCEWIQQEKDTQHVEDPPLEPDINSYEPGEGDNPY
ncbi:hypothetical protein QFC22_006263 [Naganishia vaughanmartiniae]|uniref:Uncharacterized protein n=1 Tax=Naganishia vaughanmartiniae TaxID=1424756 RepID=A0ACC2WMY1_9TREE|nr:hypothetical protein QFC22_006263 [Naganishia vaughanmartiniae]